jgi:hypothetical protein
MRYWPNPAHKRETTVAGPPAWRPDKEPCPDDLSVDERDELLEASIPRDPEDPASRRWVARRGPNGLELYDVKCSGEVAGEPEFHGHPASFVPAVVLRQLRDAGQITAVEYRQLTKTLGCP